MSTSRVSNNHLWYPTLDANMNQADAKGESEYMQVM